MNDHECHWRAGYIAACLRLCSRAVTKVIGEWGPPVAPGQVRDSWGEKKSRAEHEHSSTTHSLHVTNLNSNTNKWTYHLKFPLFNPIASIRDFFYLYGSMANWSFYMAGNQLSRRGRHQNRSTFSFVLVLVFFCPHFIHLWCCPWHFKISNTVELVRDSPLVPCEELCVSMRSLTCRVSRPVSSSGRSASLDEGIKS